MELDNFSLRCLIEELKDLVQGAYVNKVSEIENGIIKLKLHTKKGSKDLILAKNFFFITSFSHNARQNKTTFAEVLRKVLYNKRIIGVEQHGSDRVVKILFIEHVLVLELMGKGNKILLDKQNKILASERNEEWSDRTTKKGVLYNFPAMNLISPIGITKEILQEAFYKSEKNLVRTLIGSVNLSPLFAEEIIYRLKVDKNKKATEVSEKEIEKIAKLISDLFDVKKEFLSPCLYESFAYPIKLFSLKEEPRIMQDFNSCIDEIFSKGEKQEEKIEKKNSSTKLEFLKKQQEEAKEKFTKAIEENTKKGELIYSKLNEIEEIRKEVWSLAKKGLKEQEILKHIEEKSLQKPFFRMLKNVILEKKKIEIEIQE